MPALAEGVADIRSAISSDTWDLASFLEELTETVPGPPFGAEAIEFCTELSGELLRPASGVGQAQLVSLGYWLRPAAIARMRESFERAAGTAVMVPRGLAFHVTPANVDTMFAYSWLLSLLVGNANVVRISSQETVLASRLLEAIASVLNRPAFAGLLRNNRIIRTGHDDRVAGGLSSIADVRVVWGGDDTVDYFRRFPLPKRGRDLTFPNRHSLALIDAAAVRSSSEEELAALADRFYNDAYWFDQAACSSPRLIVWQAEPGDDARDARDRFQAALSDAILRRNYEVETGLAITKLVFAFRRAAANERLHVEAPSNEVTWVRAAGPRRIRPGPLRGRAVLRVRDQRPDRRASSSRRPAGPDRRVLWPRSRGGARDRPAAQWAGHRSVRPGRPRARVQRGLGRLRPARRVRQTGRRRRLDRCTRIGPSPQERRPDSTTSMSTEATWATSSSDRTGENGSARVDAATRSVTGKSPGCGRARDRPAAGGAGEVRPRRDPRVGEVVDHGFAIDPRVEPDDVDEPVDGSSAGRRGQR